MHPDQGSRRRAIVIGSGARPALTRTLPWMSGPRGEAVAASIRAHDPAAEATIAGAAKAVDQFRTAETAPAGRAGARNPWVNTP